MLSCLRAALGLFCLVFVTVVSGAQSPDGSSPALPTATLQMGARLVLVDVAVTDSRGVPVKGLKKEDFSLIEGKTPETVVNFEEHDLPAAAAHANPPGVFTNYGAAAPNSALNILLLDALNTPMQDQMFLHQQLLQYLDHVRPGTRIAIFGLSSHLVQLQSFTSDPAVLRRALGQKRPVASALLDSPGGGDAGVGSMSDTMADQAGDSDISPQLLKNVATFEKGVQSMQAKSRAESTLVELKELAQYLAGFPGRKNLLWFSASFPINILPDATTLADTFAGDMSVQQEYRETAALLGRSQVAVYPIDARGLMVSPVVGTNVPQSQASRPGGLMQATNKFFSETASTQSTMFQMADDTGGRAFVNTNALDKAVESAIDTGSHYYTLSYTPAPVSAKEDYRTIHIKLVEGHGSDKLAYRHGYYVERPGTETAASPAAQPLTARQAAAQFGAPAATQIPFRTRVVPVASPATGKAGATRTYLVQYQADQHAFARVPMPDGTISFKVRFVALLYDNEGKVVTSASNVIPAVLNAAQLATVSREGITYRQQIAVPVRGTYTLRILVDDLVGSKVGALEVPISAVKGLPEEALAANGPAKP